VIRSPADTGAALIFGVLAVTYPFLKRFFSLPSLSRRGVRVSCDGLRGPDRLRAADRLVMFLSVVCWTTATTLCTRW